MPHEKKLVYLELQPRFPTEDVSEGNADVIGHLLRENPGIIGQSRFLQEHQRTLHHIATVSMRRGGVRMETNPETYGGFTLGFSALDFMTMLLRGRALNMQLAARQFADLYPSQPFMEAPSILESLRFIQTIDDTPEPVLSEAAIFEDEPEAATEKPSPIDVQLLGMQEADKQQSWAERYTTWPDRWPHTFELVINLSMAHADNLRFSAGAVLGAQTATELQDPFIAA